MLLLAPSCKFKEWEIKKSLISYLIQICTKMLLVLSRPIMHPFTKFSGDPQSFLSNYVVNFLFVCFTLVSMFTWSRIYIIFIIPLVIFLPVLFPCWMWAVWALHAQLETQREPLLSFRKLVCHTPLTQTINYSGLCATEFRHGRAELEGWAETIPRTPPPSSCSGRWSS